ncbi:hypothetical protein AB0O28_39365 [Microbispora sp. NPDC088329]|uniref:hypothetical protein n=1 Tax=Microbispora sp. NPDC088329 TaxID=3154869 RepID=UPI00343649D8
MSILSLVAVGAGTFGAGLFLGAIVLQPRVGPWYGRRPERAVTRVMPELQRDAAALQGRVTLYAVTERGLAPVTLALPPALSAGADLTTYVPASHAGAILPEVQS